MIALSGPALTLIKRGRGRRAPARRAGPPHRPAGAPDAGSILRPSSRWHSVDAVLGLADPSLDDVRIRIVEFAQRQRLPTVFTLTYWAEAGRPHGYAADLYAVQRRAATLVDKILKGASPADLPIEQPTKFELVINLKTAKALGLTIPPSLLARADQVIE